MNLFDWIRGVPAAVATVADIVELIRWLTGDPKAREPLVLSKVPAETKSAAIRLRQQQIAKNEFAEAVAKKLAEKSKP